MSYVLNPFTDAALVRRVSVYMCLCVYVYVYVCVCLRVIVHTQFSIFVRAVLSPRRVTDSVPTSTFDVNMQSAFSLPFLGNK